MSLYLVATTNTISGLLLCIGIGLHNIPMGLVIATTLYNSNYSKKDTLIISLIVSLSTFLGGIIMLLVGGVPHLVEGILLGITLGMLIYISMFELFHQMYHMKNKKVVFLGVVIGILLLTISMFAGHHVGHVH